MRFISAVNTRLSPRQYIAAIQTDNEPVEPILKKLTGNASKLPFIKNKEIVPILFLKSNNKTGDHILFPEQVIELCS